MGYGPALRAGPKGEVGLPTKSIVYGEVGRRLRRKGGYAA